MLMRSCRRSVSRKDPRHLIWTSDCSGATSDTLMSVNGTLSLPRGTSDRRRNHQGASENYCSSRCARAASPRCGTWARRSFLVRRNAARLLTAVDISVPVARRLVGSCRVCARKGVWKYKGRPSAACPSSRWDRPVAAPSTRTPLSRQRAERRGEGRRG